MQTPFDQLLQRRWVRWGLYVGFWTSLGLFNTAQSYFYCIHFDQASSFSLTAALVIGLSDWYLWAIFALLIVQLIRQVPFQAGSWPGTVFVHVTFNALFTALIVLAMVPLFMLFPKANAPPKRFAELFEYHFITYLVWYAWVYWSIVGFIHAWNYYRKFRERERKAAHLESRLVQAQLQLLRMQLHPHFLFNTLNAISALLHKDVDLADRMIVRLGELLRTSLENVGTQEVTLEQELNFIRPYLDIEQARFGPRLKVRMDIEPETMDAAVPTLVLQPLVENAIRHGIAPQAGPGWIAIRAWRAGDDLVLQVQDNGPGLSPEQQARFRPGVGVANTRARLEQLYGDAQSLELRNGDPGGCVVTVVLPFRESKDASTGPADADRPETAIFAKKSILSAN